MVNENWIERFNTKRMNFKSPVKLKSVKPKTKARKSVKQVRKSVKIKTKARKSVKSMRKPAKKTVKKNVKLQFLFC